MRTATIALLLVACGDPAEAPDATPIDAIPVDAAPDSYVPPDAPGSGFLPDLVLIGEEMNDPPQLTNESFSEGDAAVVEGCVGGTGLRRLMRFDTVTGNLGNLDLWLGEPGPDNPAFEWSPTHGHYHVVGYAVYRLRDGSGGVVTGHKQAFCLMDSIQIVPGTVGKYHCGNQGITAGWADVYGSYLDCQWIDITGLPSGTYTLEVEVNPEQRFDELDMTNNIWTHEVQI